MVWSLWRKWEMTEKDILQGCKQKLICEFSSTVRIPTQEENYLYQHARQLKAIQLLTSDLGFKPSTRAPIRRTLIHSPR